MEKIYGSSTRQDSLIKVGKSYYMYYGFGKDSEEQPLIIIGRDTRLSGEMLAINQDWMLR